MAQVSEFRQFTSAAEMIAARAALKNMWWSLVQYDAHAVAWKCWSEEMAKKWRPPPPQYDAHVVAWRCWSEEEAKRLRVIQGQPSAADIITAISAHFGVSVLDIKSARRTWNITYPRQIAYYAIKNLTLLSTPAIGRILGGKDHTTVLHGSNKIERLRLAGDEKVCADVTAIMAMFKVEGE